MSEIIAFVYSNGRMFDGPEGITFDGNERCMKIKRGGGFELLKTKIFDKLKLFPNQSISKIFARVICCNNPLKYMVYEISDDEDMECMMDAVDQNDSMTCLELYAEIDVAGSSRVPAQSLGSNMELHRYDVDLGSSEEDEDWNLEMEVDSIDDEEEGEIPESGDSDTDDDTQLDSNVMSSALVGSHPMMVSPVSSAQPQMQVPTQQAGQSHGAFFNSSPHYTYINWDHPDEEMNYFEGLDVPGSWQVGEELYVGLRFDSKQAVQSALKNYSMRCHQSFTVVKSTQSLLYVKCPNATQGCPWLMRAILSKKSEKWEVKKWGGPHNCVNAMLSQDHKKLDSNFVCSCILGMVRQEPGVSISLVQERIQNTFGYQISYRKAWKAKQKAIVQVFGDWDESYAMLPKWLEYMQLFADGSYYKIETNDVVVGNRVQSQLRKFHRVDKQMI